MRSRLYLLTGLFAITGFALLQIEHATGFEKGSAGAVFDQKAWEREGFTVGWTQALEKNFSIDGSRAYSGQKSLKVIYPKGAVGPAESGGQAKLMLKPGNEYYAAYWLRFSDDFSWGGEHEGGKLPGLAGGDNCSGGQSCDGTNGFSARFMWRKGGKAVLYLYHMDKPHKWGEDVPLLRKDGSAVTFPRGKWVKLVERVQINTLDGGKPNADGEVQVWFNGEEVLHRKGIRFVSNDTKIDNFYFSTFHGGNSPEWGPKNNNAIWYDDLVISEDAAGVQ